MSKLKMKKSIRHIMRFVLPVLFAVFVFPSVDFIIHAQPSQSTYDSEFSQSKADLVAFTLKRIAKSNKSTPFLKKITFSEDEMNSYLNLVYIKKYTPEVKYIKLKLNKDNYVSGLMKVKLEGKKYAKVPSFLKDIEVETSGKVECQNYRMRINFDDIRVNGTKFTPEILDEAFAAAQTRAKVKKSMYDWFNLMPGIKDVNVDYKKITLFY